MPQAPYMPTDLSQLFQTPDLSQIPLPGSQASAMAGTPMPPIPTPAQGQGALLGSGMTLPGRNVQPGPVNDPQQNHIADLMSRVQALDAPAKQTLIGVLGSLGRGIDWQPPAQHQQQEQARLGMQFQQEQAKRKALVDQITMAQQQQQQGIENARAQAADQLAQQANARAQQVSDMNAQAAPTEQAIRAEQLTGLKKTNEKPTLTEVSPGASMIDPNNPKGGAVYTAPSATQPKTPTFEEQTFADWQKKPENAGKGRDQFDIEMANAKRAPKDTTVSDQARVERSYNTRKTELDKSAQPVYDSLQRLGRLKDTIDNGSPIADSVTAPELMVVMAGGAGSGVRITTAEINNIMGGSSKWEQVKSAINQYNTDPAKANKILEPMRGQIRKLLDSVQSKLAQKESVIEDAQQKLIDTEDPKEHKQIVADTKKALAAIDSGMPSGGGKAGIVIDPNGVEHQVSDVEAAIKMHPGTKRKP